MAETEIDASPPGTEEFHWTCEAVEGWLMLSNAAEALAELDTIPARFARHPTVLALEWRTATAAQQHVRAWVAARTLCELNPHHAKAWICQAGSLRDVRGPQAAADLLHSVVDQFPSDAVMQYNLACFCAQVNDWPNACHWLLQSFASEEHGEIKEVALVDPDLKPLWDKIGESGKLVACLQPLKV